MQDQANESLRQMQVVEEAATRAEKLARARGATQKNSGRRAQRKAELSGAIARLAAAAAEAEVAGVAAEAKVVAARATRLAREATEERVSVDPAVATGPATTACAAAHATRTRGTSHAEAEAPVTQLSNLVRLARAGLGLHARLEPLAFCLPLCMHPPLCTLLCRRPGWRV